MCIYNNVHAYILPYIFWTYNFQLLFVYKIYKCSFINEHVCAYSSDHHDMRLIIIENTIRARNIKRGEKQKNKEKTRRQFRFGTYTEQKLFNKEGI